MTSKNSGLAQLWVLVGLVVMAVALPVASLLVSTNQDNRNKATYNCSEATRPGSPCLSSAGVLYQWTCNIQTALWVCDTSGPAPTVIPAPCNGVCVTRSNYDNLTDLGAWGTCPGDMICTGRVSPTPSPIRSVACQVSAGRKCDPTTTLDGLYFWSWSGTKLNCLSSRCHSVSGCTDPHIGTFETEAWSLTDIRNCSRLPQPPIPTQTPIPTSFTCNYSVGAECGYAGGPRCCTELGLECNLTSKTCQKVFPTTPPVQANPIPTNTNVALDLSCTAVVARKLGCPCKSPFHCASLKCLTTRVDGVTSSKCASKKIYY
ncbi:hypothetical protein KBC75_05310 [Candidatus Shapirobacteria bacterium]|nr:hypothetical protein [Candidatus Shapirobacteria bacterium]